MHRLGLLRILLLTLFIAPGANCQLPERDKQANSRSQYPAQWDVSVPEGTALAEIKNS